MARRGRPPKPTALKILQGNPGKRPLNQNEPMPASGIPPCPDPASDGVRRKYAAIAAICPPGVVTMADGEALKAAATCAYEAELASAALDSDGRYTTTERGSIIPHPAHKVLATALKLLGDYLPRFGLDPSARSRLHVPQPNPERDSLDEFLASG